MSQECASDNTKSTTCCTQGYDYTVVKNGFTIEAESNLERAGALDVGVTITCDGKIPKPEFSSAKTTTFDGHARNGFQK